MSNYTTQLRWLVENTPTFDFGLQDYPLFVFKNINQGIDYRKHLNDKIIEHYYFREIGFETPALFKRFLNRKLNEIMPYYNQLYESVDIEFNPLWNVDLTESFTHTVSDDGTTTSDGSVNTSGNTTNTTSETLSQSTNSERGIIHTGTGSSLDNKVDTLINRHSDMPQSNVTDDDITGSSYLSSTDYNTSNDVTNTSTTDNFNDTNTETGTTTNNNSIDSNIDNSQDTSTNNKIDSTNTRTEEYTRRNFGSSAGYLFTQNIEQWRKIMINIDMMIIEELEELFLQLW